MNPLELTQAQYLRGAASLALVVVALVVRAVAHRALHASRLPLEVQQRWVDQIRNTAVLVVAVGLVVIWIDELRDLAFSVAAVAVAVVIATKEVVLCLAGAFVRTSSGAFSVGDRIQVGEVRGDVVELGALTTTLLEVNPAGSRQTGRSVVIPNSVFVAQPVFNESFAGAYGLRSLRVPVGAGSDWQAAERRLLEAARAECGQHVEAARRHVEDVAWRKGVGPDAVEPQVSLELVSQDRTDLVLRFPAPARARGRVEQAILRRYLGEAS